MTPDRISGFYVCLDCAGHSGPCVTFAKDRDIPKYCPYAKSHECNWQRCPPGGI